jgi:hypothetical protein
MWLFIQFILEGPPAWPARHRRDYAVRNDTRADLRLRWTTAVKSRFVHTAAAPGATENCHHAFVRKNSNDLPGPHAAGRRAVRAAHERVGIRPGRVTGLDSIRIECETYAEARRHRARR